MRSGRESSILRAGAAAESWSIRARFDLAMQGIDG
jgi:hypothetical protein